MADFPHSIFASKIPTSRRAFTRGLAAVLVGASVPVAAAIMPPAQHPEIARLRAEMDAAFTDYQRSRQARRNIVTEWMPRWPAPPKELLGRYLDYGGDMERDLTGFAVEDAQDKPVYVHTARDLRFELKRTMRKRDQKELQQRIAIAEAFEQEKERIRTLSGYEAANAEYRRLAENLRSIIRTVMERPGDGLDEDLLKAHALVVVGRMEYIFQLNLGDDAHLWGPRIAAAFLAHVAKGV